MAETPSLPSHLQNQIQILYFQQSLWLLTHDLDTHRGRNAKLVQPPTKTKFKLFISNYFDDFPHTTLTPLVAETPSLSSHDKVELNETRAPSTVQNEITWDQEASDFHITGLLWDEYTYNWWIPLTQGW